MIDDDGAEFTAVLRHGELAHLEDSPVRAAANQVTNYIAAVLDGQAARDVVPFRKS